MDRDTILRRAAKLAALAADRASIEEAETAGDALARLLQEHRLSMADVTAAQLEGSIRAEDRDVAWKRALPTWAQILGAGIASATDCKVLRVSTLGKPGITVRFIGEEGDAAVAAYWFEGLLCMLPEIAERSRRQVEAAHIKRHGWAVPHLDWRKLRESFLVGASERIVNRLRDMLKPPTPAAPSDGRGLTGLKAEAIDAWLARQPMRIEKARKSEPRTFEAAAYQEGVAAADKMTLAPGVRHAGAAPLRIGG